MRKNRLYIISVCLACVLMGAPSLAAEPDFTGFEWKDAGKIMVQAGGRIKPLDTFSRELVGAVCGKSSYRGEYPVQTYFRWMSDGEHWANQPLVYVSKGELRTRMELNARPGKYFSLAELQSNAGLTQIVSEAQAREEDGEKLTFLQTKAAELMNRMHLLQMVFTHEAPLLVPTDARDPMATWLSMPQALATLDSTALSHMETGESLSDTLQVLGLAFAGLYHSVSDGRADVFNTAARLFSETQREMLYQQPQTLSRLNWEMVYNRWRPFYWAKIFLVAAFLCYLLSLRHGWNRFESGAVTALILGLLSFTGGMALRAGIAGRAPWSNMYESLLAIGWAMLVISVVWIVIKREKIIGMVASLLGFFVLGIAQFASLDRGINPLVPALQSYWLNYHVIIVLSSYACFALAMGVGHAVLINAVRTKGEVTPGLLNLTRVNLKAVQVGSLLLIAGILLGAVWANISWGRFWGWDPKETWALICWFVYIILLHGRSAGWLGWRGLAAYSVAAFPVVIMTYYGVNYYLSGLHSYGAGASSGIPWQLFVYLGVEAGFLFWALSRLKGVVPPRPKKAKSVPATHVPSSEVS